MATIGRDEILAEQQQDAARAKLSPEQHAVMAINDLQTDYNFWNNAVNAMKASSGPQPLIPQNQTQAAALGTLVPNNSPYYITQLLAHRNMAVDRIKQATEQFKTTYNHAPNLDSTLQTLIGMTGPGASGEWKQIPTDPKQFQAYLNAMGAGLTVDGVIGPKTLAAAAKYGIAVPGGNAPAASSTTSGAIGGAGTIGGGGGRSSGGGGGGVSTAPSTIPPVNLGSVEDQIRRNFGFMAWAIDDPVIGNILRDAITNHWDIAILQGKLQATDLWKTTSDTQRQWRALKSTDPASADQQIKSTAASIDEQARQLGVNINPDRLSSMAEESLSRGWDAAQMHGAIANEFHYVAGQQSGEIGRQEQSVKELGHQYLVPLSDATLEGWDRQIATGSATADNFRQYMVDTAKGLFPGLAGGLDAGMTTKQLADPYAQVAAKELGINPDSVDFTDSKWSRALNQLDPKTGTHSMMSLYDWGKTIRGDDAYGWKYTKPGQDAAYGFANQFLHAIGKVAG